MLLKETSTYAIKASSILKCVWPEVAPKGFREMRERFQVPEKWGASNRGHDIFQALQLGIGDELSRHNSGERIRNWEANLENPNLLLPDASKDRYQLKLGLQLGVDFPGDVLRVRWQEHRVQKGGWPTLSAAYERETQPHRPREIQSACTQEQAEATSKEFQGVQIINEIMNANSVIDHYSCECNACEFHVRKLNEARPI